MSKAATQGERAPGPAKKSRKITVKKTATTTILRDSDKQYHNREKYLSASLTKELYYGSPMHYLHKKKEWQRKRLEGEKAPKHFDFGKAVHAAILEPNKFKKQYGFYDEDKRPNKKISSSTGKPYGMTQKDNKAWKEKKQATYERRGGHLLDKKTYENVIKARDNALKSKYLRSLIGLSEFSEHSFYQEDSETGLLIRARPDLPIPSKQMIVEVKTTRDAKFYPTYSAPAIESGVPTITGYLKKGFYRQVLEYHYYFQNAFHARVLNQALDLPPSEQFFTWLIIAVENTPPFDVNVFPMSADWVHAGHAHVQKALELFQHCQEKNQWPGTGVWNLPDEDGQGADLVYLDCPEYLHDTKFFNHF